MVKKIRQGFTLIELLMVIAIISLLLSILLPSLNQALSLARDTLCQANTRSLGQAVIMYVGENKESLPAVDWNTQYRQLDLLADYAGGEMLFHCPQAARQATRGVDIDRANGSAYFHTIVDSRLRYTDYKLNDNSGPGREPITTFADPRWVVTVLDNDWTIYFPPYDLRHDGRSSLGFLDGRVEFMARSEFMEADSYDRFGNDRWYNWGFTKP